jgi:hypothetical protein
MKRYRSLALVLSMVADTISVPDELQNKLANLKDQLLILSETLQGTTATKKEAPATSYALILQKAEESLYTEFLNAGNQIVQAYNDNLSSPTNSSYLAITDAFEKSLQTIKDAFTTKTTKIVTDQAMKELLEDKTLKEILNQDIQMRREFQTTLENAQKEYQALLVQQENGLLDAEILDANGDMLLGISNAAYEEKRAGLESSSKTVEDSIRNAEKRFSSIADVLSKEVLDAAKKSIATAKDAMLREVDAKVAKVSEKK